MSLWNRELKWKIFVFSGEIRIEVCSLVKFRIGTWTFLRFVEKILNWTRTFYLPGKYSHVWYYFFYRPPKNLELNFKFFIGEIRIELCSLVKFRIELEYSRSKYNFSYLLWKIEPASRIIISKIIFLTSLTFLIDILNVWRSSIP